jgi:hypothetical protein
MTTFFRPFEINIVSALSDQLTEALDSLTPADLDSGHIGQVPAAQGIYTLWHQGALVYVGKADKLSKRLQEHHEKISGRRNMSLNDMKFSALLVHPNWTALAPESALIRHYKAAGAACDWNGNGFGPHDPGRDRETTNKAPDGFDALFPIEDQWRCPWFTSKVEWDCLELLVKLKRFLPYVLRYETEQIGPDKFAHYTKGHPDQSGQLIRVPTSTPPTTARGILALIASSIPGWQATVFPSHMILYKERRAYRFGNSA